MNLMKYFDKIDDLEIEVSSIQVYFDSLYFVVTSMTGLGVSPVYARTDLEYSMHTMIMILGVSIYANFFAFFVVTIYKRNRERIQNLVRFEESR